MSRTRKSAVAAVALSVLLLAAGCGGSSSNSSNTPTDTRKPPRSAEVPPPRLPRPDRRAYAAILKASGDLRAAVTPAAYGTAARIPADQLRLDITKLQALAPQSAELGRLRGRTLQAMRSATAGGPGRTPKAIASAAIAEADRIDAGLRRYAASNPAANEVAPG